MIFELPSAPCDFTERAAQIRGITEAAKLPWQQAVAQFRMADTAALQGKLRAVVRQSGEGLMPHRDDRHYETRRFEILLKVTPWLDAAVGGHATAIVSLRKMECRRFRGICGCEISFDTGWQQAVRMTVRLSS